MNLSKNFTLAEMLKSDTAEVLGIEEQYKPSPLVVKNLTLLCAHVLQPLRDFIGKPIKVTSGYRCPRVNVLVGGQNTSQHKYGQAADLQGMSGVSNKELYDAIIELKLPFCQLIWEFGDDKNPRWVHVSYSSRHRRQILRIK